MRRFALALGLAAFISGCGGGQHKTAPLKTIGGHVCTPKDEALQCILPPAPKHLAPPPTSGSIIRGVDFAWGAPSASTMRQRYGASFGASYLSFDSAKGWTQRAGLVSEYHRAGIATVAVWETTANRAGQGCAAGRADALEASRQADAIGNTTATIDFAIDFDASGEQVASYFACAHRLLGPRTGAYGGYRPLQYLCAHGLVGRHNWQTYAWSSSRWLPASCAPLEQYLNDTSVDYDRAIAADYGQWPSPHPAPTPAEHRAALKRELKKERALIAELHGDIERHTCRPGQHAKPPRYHSLCGRWLHKGDVAHAHAKRLERELRR